MEGSSPVDGNEKNKFNSNVSEDTLCRLHCEEYECDLRQQQRGKRKIVHQDVTEQQRRKQQTPRSQRLHGPKLKELRGNEEGQQRQQSKRTIRARKQEKTDLEYQSNGTHQVMQQKDNSIVNNESKGRNFEQHDEHQQDEQNCRTQQATRENEPEEQQPHKERSRRRSPRKQQESDEKEHMDKTHRCREENQTKVILVQEHHQQQQILQQKAETDNKDEEMIKQPPSNRRTVLCLGVSYPDLRKQIKNICFGSPEIDDEDILSLDNSDDNNNRNINNRKNAHDGATEEVGDNHIGKVLLSNNNEWFRNPDSIYECVQRKILTEMDGRDLLRCVMTEQACDADVYTVSQEAGAIYRSDRHVDANFNRSISLIRKIKQTFGDDIQFDQIILDYFWIPPSWNVDHWKRSFMEETITAFTTSNILRKPKTPLPIQIRNNTHNEATNPSSQMQELGQVDDRSHSGTESYDENSGTDLSSGIIYLPFCLYCFKEILACFQKSLSLYYNVRFIRKNESEELDNIALWNGTQQIHPEKMQTILGKQINQEDIYCTFGLSDIKCSMTDLNGASIESVLKTAYQLEDFHDIRFMALEPIPTSKQSRGKILGLVDQAEVKNGIQKSSDVKPYRAIKVIKPPLSDREKRVRARIRRRNLDTKNQIHRFKNKKVAHRNGKSRHQKKVRSSLDDYDESNIKVTQLSQNCAKSQSTISLPRDNCTRDESSIKIDEVDDACKQVSPTTESTNQRNESKQKEKNSIHRINRISSRRSLRIKSKRFHKILKLSSVVTAHNKDENGKPNGINCYSSPDNYTKMFSLSPTHDDNDDIDRHGSDITDSSMIMEAAQTLIDLAKDWFVFTNDHENNGNTQYCATTREDEIHSNLLSASGMAHEHRDESKVNNDNTKYYNSNDVPCKGKTNSSIGKAEWGSSCNEPLTCSICNNSIVTDEEGCDCISNVTSDDDEIMSPTETASVVTVAARTGDHLITALSIAEDDNDYRSNKRCDDCNSSISNNKNNVEDKEKMKEVVAKAIQNYINLTTDKSSTIRKAGVNYHPKFIINVTSDDDASTMTTSSIMVCEKDSPRQNSF